MFYFRFIVFFIFFTCVLKESESQGKNSDYSWWNQIHGWKEGSPGWQSFMIISPGYLGPNALPVPDVKKGLIFGKTEIELTSSFHYLKGDPTQDLSTRIYIPFANNRIAVEMSGVAIEHYSYTEKIRNERFSRNMDGKGFDVGDFYFTTLIQVIKNNKYLPNTLFRFSTKTASGNLNSARYTDTPGYFLDLSFSREFGKKPTGTWRPFAMYGFYCWQTYDLSNPQNDAHLYAFGSDFEIKTFLLSASLSGYSGYKENRDKPVQLNFDIRKDYKNTAFRIQYLHGLRDWEYKTIRISLIGKFNR